MCGRLAVSHCIGRSSVACVSARKKRERKREGNMHGCVTLAEKEKDVRCGRTREKPRIVYKLGPGKDDMHEE